MPGRLVEWPAWPEFSLKGAESGNELIAYKKTIIAEYGQEALTKAWLRTCQELESLTDHIAKLGTEAIPVVEFDDLCDLPADQKQALKNVGCFKVKQVVSRDQADQWFADLKAYVAANKSKIKGWPSETPFILNLYYSPTQLAARSHPNILKLSRELNSWWHDPSSSASSAATAEPLSYADGVRIRPPGIPFHGLGPHIDAGSLARWADPTYRSVFSCIFSGRPEDYDPYDLSIRQHADQAAFPGTAHSTVFRSFQGWTALSPAAPGEGSLMLYPDIKWTIAYVLLRPFFKAPKAPEDVMDASKWIFDAETPWFPGTFQEDSQLLSPSSHPHLRMKECMVSIPAMDPGDTIWWHADMCHAVEVEHRGKVEGSVAYIGATPSTEQNKRYMKQQLQDFMHGLQPSDFRHSLHDLGSKESELEGFPGEAGILSEEGRRAMGFNLLAQG